jgi:small-conductance mechanosensitive channel
MSDFFRLWGVNKFFTDLPHTLLAQIESPVFLIQCGLIAALWAAAYWLSLAARPGLTASAERMLPHNWVPSFVRVCESVEQPFFWMALLWLVLTGVEMTGAHAPLIDAGVELLAAWVCIRLLSLSLKSPVASVLVSFVVWCIAALSILGMLDSVVHQLSVSALRFGKYKLSALTALHAVFALCVLLWLTMLLFRFLERQISRAASLTPSLRVLFVQLLQILLPALAVIVALSAAGVNLTALTVISGAIFLGIGLGLQRLVANLVAGLTLLIGKSIKPGDVIAYKDNFGYVTEMGARFVTLRTLDNAEHLIPNDYFLETGVDNWSHSDDRIDLGIPIGIAYESDVRQAMALAETAARTVPRVLQDPAPCCMVKNFGDSAVELMVYVSIVDPRNGVANVKSGVLLAIWDAFKAAGISFPFPQRDVRIVAIPDALLPKPRS